MKQFFLLVVSLLIFISDLFAVPSVELREKIIKESMIPFDMKYDVKDSNAQSAGMIGIIECKDFRGFTPSMLKNIVSSPDGYYCGIFSPHFNGFTFDNIFQYLMEVSGVLQQV
ncbi:MAG: hypothetical protein ABIN35_06650 [candidate division WOR-3 bacterium]